MPAAIQAPARQPPVQDGLPRPQRTWSMVVILLGIAVAVLDGTIVNLALPGIAQELQASPSAAIWVINAYQIATLVMLLPLSLAVAIVYKTIHCRELRDVPIAASVLWVTIVLGMLAVGAVLYVVFFLLA